MNTLKKVFAVAMLSFLGFLGVGVSAMSTGITSTDGVIAFEQADKDAINQGVANAISNLWNAFTVVLPYIASFIGVAFVIGILMALAMRRKG